MMQKMADKKGYWIFLGMMGSGKTTLGQTVAKMTKKPFLDTDFLVEKRNNATSLEIFQQKGESFFRAEETVLLQRLTIQQGILGTGGGLVMKKENWREIRRLGISIFLDVDPLILKRRVEENRFNRPLLQHKNWQEKFDELYQFRRPFYLQSDFVIQLADTSIQENASSLIELMNQYGN